MALRESEISVCRRSDVGDTPSPSPVAAIAMGERAVFSLEAPIGLPCPQIAPQTLRYVRGRVTQVAVSDKSQIDLFWLAGRDRCWDGRQLSPVIPLRAWRKVPLTTVRNTESPEWDGRPGGEVVGDQTAHRQD